METHPGPYYGFQEFHLGEDGRSGEHHRWLAPNYPEYTNKPDHEIPVELHNSYWSTSHTINFIRDCAVRNEPFFAFCSFVDPHQGYNPPSPYREMYREEDMPPPIRREGELDKSRFKISTERGAMKQHNERVAYNRAQHYGEMSFIDDSVGRMLKILDELKIRDNTLIIFASDHGDMLGDHWLWWKGAFHYRGCSNVPLFFNWPGHLRQAKMVDGIVQLVDILPTILDLTGIETPPGVQGKSQIDVLTTGNEETGYEFAYIESIASGEYHSEYMGDNGARGAPERNHRPTDTLTIRNLKWRFSYYTGTPDGELYDLENDPNEFNNLWNDGSFKNIKTELMISLLNRCAATRDPMPLKIRPY